MAVDAVADMVLKQPLELVERDAGLKRKRRARQRRLDAPLYGAENEEQLLARHAEPVAEIHALRAEALADMGVQSPTDAASCCPWSRSISATIMSSAEMPSR
jgi:hypothetical protein